MTNAAKVEERSLTLVDEAKSVQVSDQATMDNANNLLTAIKALRKEVADTFDPIISKAHKAHAEALAQKKKMDAPLADAEKALKRGITTFFDIQNTKRLEEQRLAQEMTDAGLGELVTQEYVPTPKLQGGHTRIRWHAEVVDKGVLIKAVASGRVSTEALNPNMPYLNSQATANKGIFNIPGVEAIWETSVVSTRRSK